MNEIPTKLLEPVQALIPYLWGVLKAWSSVEKSEVDKEHAFIFILGGVLCSFVEYLGTPEEMAQTAVDILTNLSKALKEEKG